MRFAGQVDENQAFIAEGLRKAGRSVRILSAAGDGIPDLLVGYHGINYLLEVKIEKGKLTPAQKKFFDSWQGQAVVVRSLDQALFFTSG